MFYYQTRNTVQIDRSCWRPAEDKLTVVATYLFPQCWPDCLACCLMYCPTEGASRIYCRLHTLCLIIAQKAFIQTFIIFVLFT